MSRRLRRYLKSAFAVLALVLVAAACSSDGFPVGYDDQVDETTNLSNVEANWQNGCEAGFGTELGADLAAVCGCSYRQIKENIPFDEFVDVNNRLKDDPSSLTTSGREGSGSTEALIVEIVKGCIASN